MTQHPTTPSSVPASYEMARAEFTRDLTDRARARSARVVADTAFLALALSAFTTQHPDLFVCHVDAGPRRISFQDGTTTDSMTNLVRWADALDITHGKFLPSGHAMTAYGTLAGRPVELLTSVHPDERYGLPDQWTRDHLDTAAAGARQHTEQSAGTVSTEGAGGAR